MKRWQKCESQLWLSVKRDKKCQKTPLGEKYFMCDPGSARVQLCPTIPNYSAPCWIQHLTLGQISFHSICHLSGQRYLMATPKQFADYNRGEAHEARISEVCGKDSNRSHRQPMFSRTNCKIYLFKYQNIAVWNKRTEIHIDANQCPNSGWWVAVYIHLIQVSIG